MMESLLGLLRVRVIRGNNLAIRDVRSSDPYVVIKMGKQKLKTRVVNQNLNPEWNDDLTLCVADANHMVKLVVYDYDTFSLDDKMGEAEFDIKPFLEAVKTPLEGLPSGTVVSRVIPSRKNCLAEESCVIYKDGKVVQDMCLRLQNVECGEVELQLQWIDLPGSKVYDRDRFSLDDKMGEAEFDIKPFVEVVKMRLEPEGLPSGTVVTRVTPSRENCLAEESSVVFKDGKVVQDMCLRLQNVECGEVELQLQWIDLPGSKGL